MESKKLNILLADDDIDDCTFFTEALVKLDIFTNLEVVHDGEELMQMLKNDALALPDVIFLDINMPRKNGMECLHEIKYNKRLADLPVVMLSTSNAKETIDLAFKSGAHVYIHKPGDFAQLIQVIHNALPIASEKVFSKSPLKYILNA